MGEQHLNKGGYYQGTKQKAKIFSARLTLRGGAVLDSVNSARSLEVLGHVCKESVTSVGLAGRVVVAHI